MLYFVGFKTRAPTNLQLKQRDTMKQREPMLYFVGCKTRAPTNL